MFAKKEAYEIIGAAISVHRELGAGMKEVVYADALEIEMRLKGIPYKENRNITLSIWTLNYNIAFDVILYVTAISS